MVNLIEPETGIFLVVNLPDHFCGRLDHPISIDPGTLAFDQPFQSLIDQYLHLPGFGGEVGSITSDEGVPHKADHIDILQALTDVFNIIHSTISS